MAPATQHDLCESHRAPRRPLCLQKIKRGWMRRILLPETTTASTGRAKEGRSSRDSGPAKFENAIAPPSQYSRFDRGFGGSKRKPPAECPRQMFRATLFAMSAPGLDKENRVSLRK